MIGLLEGFWGYYERIGGDKEGGERDGGNGGKEGDGERERVRIGKLLRQAREELAVERVFGAEWWGEGGWRYEVFGGGQGDGKGDGGGRYEVVGDKNGEVTWKEVVDQHPVVREWERRVGEELERLGVRRGVFEGEGWEGGRVGG